MLMVKSASVWLKFSTCLCALFIFFTGVGWSWELPGTGISFTPPFGWKEFQPPRANIGFMAPDNNSVSISVATQIYGADPDNKTIDDIVDMSLYMFKKLPGFKLLGKSATPVKSYRARRFTFMTDACQITEIMVFGNGKMVVFAYGAGGSDYDAYISYFNQMVQSLTIAP